ncbi:MAG: DUF368 domain-containing protein [Clostridiales bacterium]|nr:DUF368 domain-containing protein [Clostridiales bacterium]
MGETVDLSFKNKKQWFKAMLLGFLIGLAVILPGISGATIAIIFGLYSKMIFSFGNIFKHFKKCIMFLLPIGIGLVFGFVIGFFFVQEVFEAYPFIVICLFAGLMIGSFPAVKDEIKGVKWNKKRAGLISVGVVIPIAIGLISVLVNSSSNGPIKASPMLMILYFLMGLVVSVTQIIPGISCSALLMAFGQFGAILASVHFDYLKSNPLVILTLFMLALGFIVGIVVFSKLLNKLLEKKRENTFTVIVGLSLGSIVTMFLNPDIFNAYKSWSSVGIAFKSLSLGVVLLVVGVAVSYALVKYQRKLNEKKKNEQIDSSVESVEKNENNLNDENK